MIIITKVCDILKLPDKNLKMPLVFSASKWVEPSDIKSKNRDFAGVSVVKTLYFQCQGIGSSPGWRAKITQDLWPKNQNKQKKKQKERYNKFNKDKKNGPHKKVFTNLN